MNSYEAEAEALARKAIGWRKVAVDERHRREEVEREHAKTNQDRATWQALDRLQPPRRFSDAAAWESAFAYLHLEMRERTEPLTMDEAGEIMANLCRLLLECAEVGQWGPSLIQWRMAGAWDPIERALRTGSIDDPRQWADLLDILRPPPLTRALLQVLYESAPVSDGSDPYIEVREGEV